MNWAEQRDLQIEREQAHDSLKWLTFILSAHARSVTLTLKARTFTYGTRAAQEAVPIPTIRNRARVDHASARRDCGALAVASVAARVGIGTDDCDSGTRPM